MDHTHTGEKEITCENTGIVIGQNTGVYLGGAPDDVYIREELDIRKQVGCGLHNISLL